MKKITGIALVLAFVITGCNSTNDKTKETTVPVTTVTDSIVKKESSEPIAEQLYSCSMHPEVKGKKDSACSKCGMKLTVLVKN